MSRRRARILTTRFVSGPVILPHVPRYVLKWHTCNEWAREATENLGDGDPFMSENPRVSGWRGTWVRDLENEEEAFERGVPIHKGIDVVPPGPTRDDGGTRRVSIRMHTWVLDARHGAAYDPQWITSGWGMSGRAATLAHYRYLYDYALAVSRGIESRKLLATALEIVFWTASHGTDYV
jgi:hypothetical protein